MNLQRLSRGGLVTIGLGLVALAVVLASVVIVIDLDPRARESSGQPEATEQEVGPAPAAAAGALPPGVSLRDVDGGADYFAEWPNGLPSDASFFPIGVWLQCISTPSDAALFADAGINVFNAVCENSDLGAIPDTMHVLAQIELNSISSHPWIDGRLLGDEADMIFGPGRDSWNGEWGWNDCIPPQDEGGQCGYTVLRTNRDRAPADGTPRYANFGFGIAEWETDAEAAVFVNDSADFVSADVYYFTHPDKAEQRHGRFYGELIDRLRFLDGLDGIRKPIWAFVELGHPFAEEWAPTIAPPQIRSAVWHSIIAGARGVTYFNHSFGDADACASWNVIDTCDEVRSTVTKIDSQIHALAPVLNAPFADGYVSSATDMRTMAKLGPDGAWYVFAASTGQGATVDFDVAAGSTVEVMFEDRSLPLTGGRFTDSFADAGAVHIYRISG